jgi:hypothetical protein
MFFATPHITLTYDMELLLLTSFRNLAGRCLIIIINTIIHVSK